MKNRIERINQLIREKIAEILSRNIFIKGSLITVQEVSTSKDLNHAKIKVSVMPFSESAKVMKILEKQAPTIQAKLNSVVRIKFVPRIKFYLDVSEEKAGKVEEILKSLNN